LKHGPRRRTGGRDEASPGRHPPPYTGRVSDDIREVARKRIKARRDFWYMIAVFVVVSILLIAVWAFTGAHSYFWPMWPLFGFGIATVFTALSVFGPTSRPISQERIDDEVRKLGGDPRA
jgi:uncharacterized membrane protein